MNSSRPIYEKNYYGKKEIDMAVEEALERVYGPFSVKINLAVEKLTNKTEKFLESAENLMGLENYITIIKENVGFPRIVKELGGSQAILKSIDDVSEIRRFATSLPNRNWMNYISDEIADETFIQKVNQTLNLTRSEAQRNLLSKIEEEKSKLRKYIATNIDDVSKLAQTNSVIENSFSNLVNTSSESLSEAFDTHQQQLTVKLQERLGTYLPNFNATDVDLLASGLEHVQIQADKVMDKTLNEVVEDVKKLIDEFLLSSKYINDVTNQAITERLANKTQTDLIAQEVMSIMKSWQEAQFGLLDSLLTNNQVRREVLRTNFRDEMGSVVNKAVDVKTDVLALLNKRLKLMLWDKKSQVMKSLLQDTSAVAGQFFFQTKLSLNASLSNFTRHPEILQYLDMMVDIVKIDTVLGVEMNTRETLAYLFFSNATRSPVSILKTLAQLSGQDTQEIKTSGQDSQEIKPSVPDSQGKKTGGLDSKETKTNEGPIGFDLMPSARRDFGGDGRGHLVVASSSDSSKCLTSGG